MHLYSFGGIPQKIIKLLSLVLVSGIWHHLLWMGKNICATDEKTTNPAQWRGQNLLGIALMQVRALLSAEK